MTENNGKLDKLSRKPREFMQSGSTSLTPVGMHTHLFSQAEQQANLESTPTKTRLPKFLRTPQSAPGMNTAKPKKYLTAIAGNNNRPDDSKVVESFVRWRSDTANHSAVGIHVITPITNRMRIKQCQLERCYNEWSIVEEINKMDPRFKNPHCILQVRVPSHDIGDPAFLPCSSVMAKNVWGVWGDPTPVHMGGKVRIMARSHHSHSQAFSGSSSGSGALGSTKRRNGIILPLALRGLQVCELQQFHDRFPGARSIDKLAQLMHEIPPGIFIGFP
jgi:hypothetical protein